MILILRHASDKVEHTDTKSWVRTHDARYTRHSTIRHPSLCVRCRRGDYVTMKHQELSRSRTKAAWTSRSQNHWKYSSSSWLLAGVPLRAVDYIR